MSEASLLIGDIGGTNARFALANPVHGGYANVLELKCVDFADIHSAIQHYLELTQAPDPMRICLAVAGPVQNQQASLTNNPWLISAHALGQEFPGAAVYLVNDFSAVAHAIPLLLAKDRLSIGSRPAPSLSEGDFNIGVLGPGTGLGVSGLLRRGGSTIPVVGEAGHAGFAPETTPQVDLLKALHRQYPRVSNERLLSGMGVENIHRALQQLQGQVVESLSAAEIFAAAEAGKDTVAHTSVELFFEILGQVAGDLALTLGAVDGVFIAGGICPRYPHLMARSGFREGFENKGRHRPYMQDISTQLVTHPNAGLLGASDLVQQPAV